MYISNDTIVIGAVLLCWFMGVQYTTVNDILSVMLDFSFWKIKHFKTESITSVIASVLLLMIQFGIFNFQNEKYN